MAGATSPATLAATVIQNNAEVLAGLVLAQLINPGTPVVYGNTSSVTDLRSMNLSIGAPECPLLMAAFSQLARYYQLPFRSGGGLTDAKDLDAQAGMESATNLLCTYFSGVDFVLHAIGITESFLGVDYEKWICDEEIIARIRRLTRGLGEVSGSLLPLIARPAGHFLDSEDTLRNHKKEFFQPVVSDRNSFETWSSGNRDYRARAESVWTSRLEKFVAPLLPEEILKELIDYLSSRLAPLK
jgi:trimethylamine--corrinoid protein Co-methyltransferase